MSRIRLLLDPSTVQPQQRPRSASNSPSAYLSVFTLARLASRSLRSPVSKERPQPTIRIHQAADAIALADAIRVMYARDKAL